MLGDPAARLALQGKEGDPRVVKEVPVVAAVPAKAPESPAPAATNTTDVTPAATTTKEVEAAPAVRPPSDVDREAAVIAMLRGDEAPRVIAARIGASLELVWSWVDTYRRAGQGALAGPAVSRVRRIRSVRPS